MTCCYIDGSITEIDTLHVDKKCFVCCESAHPTTQQHTNTNNNRELYQTQFHHNAIIFFNYSECRFYLFDVCQFVYGIGFEWRLIFILYLYYKLKPTRDGFIKNTVRTFCSHGENFQVRMHKMIYWIVLQLIILIGRGKSMRWVWGWVDTSSTADSNLHNFFSNA